MMVKSKAKANSGEFSMVTFLVLIPMYNLLDVTELLLISGGQTIMTKSKHTLQLSLPLPTQHCTTIDNVHPVVGESSYSAGSLIHASPL